LPQPSLAARLVSRARTSARRLRERRLGQLPVEEAFDRMYRDRVWAGDSDMLSGHGSYGRMAETYAFFVTDFVRRNGITSITDIGCGDFNVGRMIAPGVARYAALDISPTIIARNVARNDLPHVTFAVANACTNAIPHADLVTVRQVFQHLTNAQIAAALANIEAARPRFILVTEHWPGAADMQAPNRDLPSHSSGVRVALGSGVVLSEPPFSRKAEVVWECPVTDGDARGERLVGMLVRG
jgi:SAM-dependent methyltransferase